MSPLNRREKRAARELAKAEGINYTTALRLVREAHEAEQSLAAAHGPGADPQSEYELSAYPWNRFGIYAFSEYKGRIIIGRQPGVAQLGWAAGVLADGSIARDSFLTGAPHLLVAGHPGSGKSVLLYSAFHQIVHNNGPAEVRFRIVTPDGVLPFYRDLDVVEWAAPSWNSVQYRTTAYLAAVADMLQDNVEDMEWRRRLFMRHSDAPTDLSEARAIAARESRRAGVPVESHPLHLPYIIVVLDECDWLFDGDSLGEELLERQRIRAAVEEIARKGRSAGFHLVCTAQHASPAWFPAAVWGQSRVIGLHVSDEGESVAAIGEPGLERALPPGVGKIAVGGRYVDFRAFAVPAHLYAPGTPGEVEEAARELPEGSKPGTTGLVPSPEESRSIRARAVNDLITAARRAAPHVERAKATEVLQGTLHLFKSSSLERLRAALDGDNGYRTALIGRAVLIGSSETDALDLLNSLE